MNLTLYLASYFGVMLWLSWVAWLSPRALGLPTLGRVLMGATATPLLLPVLTLVLATIWPMAPRVLILSWPAFLVLVLVLCQQTAFRHALSMAKRRIQRFRLTWDRAVMFVGGGVIVVSVLAVVMNNACQPLDAHDALIYFTEARLFAVAPAWRTYLGMVNPVEAGAWVSGHTHTWLYSTFIAPALLATDSAEVGARHDLVARLAVQFNLVLLLLAISALSWVVLRPRGLFAVLTLACVVSLPNLSYLTVASSIDAFRFLPLVLLASILGKAPQSKGGWIICAALFALAVAAHTLNIIFAPLLVLARLLSGLTAQQRAEFVRHFLPWCALLLLPVGAFYLNLWSETGKFLGNGLSYVFLIGTPLEIVAQSRLLLATAVPSLNELVAILVRNYGYLHTACPLVGAAMVFMLGRKRPEVIFLALFFVLSALLILSGCAPRATPRLTLLFIGNVRYSLFIWIMGVPLSLYGARLLGRRLVAFCSLPALSSRIFIVLLALVAVEQSVRGIARNWPIPYSTAKVLEEGELRVSSEVKQVLRPGETWLADYNTLTYYCDNPPTYLYTPNGCRWIKERDASIIWSRLLARRVRLVAFNNLDDRWWPSTALYAAITRPGRAQLITLQRWRIYVLNLPEHSP